MVEAAGDIHNEYDMAIGSITVKAYRALVCNFTRSIYLTGLRLLAQRPKPDPASVWEFLKPFHWEVWIMLLITVVFSAVVLQVLDPEGIATERTGNSYFDALFYTTNVFFFVHEADIIKPKLARAFLLVLQFIMHVLLASYTANMASFLSAKQTDVTLTTYTDLVHQPIGTREGTTNWLYAKDELGMRNLIDVNNAAGAIKSLRSEEIKVYFGDSPHIENIAAEQCDLVVVGTRVGISAPGG